MKKLFSTIIAEFYHGIATLNDHITIWIHAKSTDDVYEWVNIGS